jgi:hypothetical protein
MESDASDYLSPSFLCLLKRRHDQARKRTDNFHPTPMNYSDDQRSAQEFRVSEESSRTAKTMTVKKQADTSPLDSSPRLGVFFILTLSR